MKRITVDNLLNTLEELRNEFLSDSPSAQMVCEHLENEILDRVGRGKLDVNDVIIEFN
jgi:hypothetical protein